MTPVKVTIDARIKAKVNKVWEYWNNPQHITCWNFAHESWCCPRSQNDLKVGGKFITRMEARDGSFGFDFEGTYTEVSVHQKIAYTMPDGRKVSSTFVENGEATHLTTVFDAESQNPVELQQQGWQAILNNFKAYVENN